MRTITDANDCIYTGQVLNGISHGNGNMVCPDPINSEYQGEWETGKCHGKGRYTWPTGEYDGEF